MDAGNGRFITAESVEDLYVKYREIRPGSEAMPHVFRRGDVVEIHGSQFRISAIGKRFMTLRLLPQKADS